MKFRFELGDEVIFKHKGEKATVVARAEHLGGVVKYLLQRDGGASWANDDAIDAASPEEAAQGKPAAAKTK